MSMIVIDGRYSNITEVTMWLYHNISSTHTSVECGVVGDGWKFILTYVPEYHWEITIDDEDRATEFKLRFL